MNPIILLILLSIIGKIAMDNLGGVSAPSGINYGLWAGLVLAVLVILLGELINKRWLQSRLIRAVFFLLGISIAVAIIFKKVALNFPSISGNSLVSWYYAVAILALVAVFTFGGWTKYKAGGGWVSVWVFYIGMTMLIGGLPLLLILGPDLSSDVGLHLRNGIRGWVRSSIEGPPSSPVVNLPNAAVPSLQMPGTIFGLSWGQLLMGVGLVVALYFFLPRLRAMVGRGTASASTPLKVGGLLDLLLVGLAAAAIYAVFEPQFLGQLKAQYPDINWNMVAVGLAFLVLYRLMGLWLGLLFAFLLALYLFPSFGPTVMGTVERVRQGDAASVYADGTGSQDLLPGQTAEPVVHDPGHAASVRINARECRSGLTDAAIMFPRESGWHIDMSSLAPRHDVLVWKYTPATGWHYYNFREFGQLEAEGTGNADGEMYKVCRFPGGDPIVLVTFLKV